jgi:hypothetical protein
MQEERHAQNGCARGRRKVTHVSRSQTGRYVRVFASFRLLAHVSVWSFDRLLAYWLASSCVVAQVETQPYSNWSSAKVTELHVFQLSLVSCLSWWQWGIRIARGAETAQSAQRLATGWTLEGSEFESHLGQNFSLLDIVLTSSWAHPDSCPMGTGVFFSRGKAARTWSWPLTTNVCRAQKYMELYIHSPIRLHDILLN